VLTYHGLMQLLMNKNAVNQEINAHQQCVIGINNAMTQIKQNQKFHAQQVTIKLLLQEVNAVPNVKIHVAKIVIQTENVLTVYITKKKQMTSIIKFILKSTHGDVIQCMVVISQKLQLNSLINVIAAN